MDYYVIDYKHESLLRNETYLCSIASMISALYEHFPHLLVRLNFFFSSKSLTFHSGLSENTV